MSQSAEQAAREFLQGLDTIPQGDGTIMLGRVVYAPELAALLTARDEAIRASERERCIAAAKEAIYRWLGEGDGVPLENRVVDAIAALSPGTADAGEGAND